MTFYDFSKPLAWVKTEEEDEVFASEVGREHGRLMCGAHSVGWTSRFYSEGAVYGGSIAINRTGPTEMTIPEMKDHIEKSARQFTGPDAEGRA